MGDAARRVAHRLGTRLEPAIRTVRSPESCSQVEPSSLVGASPRLGGCLEVILMDHGVLHLEFHDVVQGPTEVLRASPDAAQSSTGIIGQTGIDVIGFTVGCRAPYHRPQGFDQPRETLFALAPRPISPLPVVAVDVQAVPADLPTLVIA